MGITRAKQSETLESNNFWTTGQEFSLKKKLSYFIFQYKRYQNESVFFQLAAARQKLLQDIFKVANTIKLYSPKKNLIFVFLHTYYVLIGWVSDSVLLPGSGLQISRGSDPVSAHISWIQIWIQILGKKECRMCSKSRKLKKKTVKNGKGNKFLLS